MTALKNEVCYVRKRALFVYLLLNIYYISYSAIVAAWKQLRAQAYVGRKMKPLAFNFHQLIC